ncbi:SSI family serine proteinase inhibitor [Streptomyces sp. NPDC008121]|uniref:SSI family serine proteinase inhibitor n=1 Tax=Streptomyces sp. NPDC008121 TaxID=3364809 RepID=UPI0036EA9EE2
MRMPLRFAGAATAAGLAAAALLTHPQTAAAAPAGLYPPSALVLTVSHPGAEDGTAARAVTLSCAPEAAGTHPAAAAACADLHSTDGQPGALLPAGPGYACAGFWAPVSVTVDGVWQGARVSWKHTFANACAMESAAAQTSLLGF